MMLPVGAAQGEQGVSYAGSAGRVTFCDFRTLCSFLMEMSQAQCQLRAQSRHRRPNTFGRPFLATVHCTLRILISSAQVLPQSQLAAAAAALTIAWNGASDTRRETCVKSSARHDKIRLPVSLSECVCLSFTTCLLGFFFSFYFTLFSSVFQRKKCEIVDYCAEAAEESEAEAGAVAGSR